MNELSSIWKLFTILCQVIRWFTRIIPKRGVFLIVEDDASDAELLQYRLRKLGWRSEIATSGEVAQGLVKHSHYPVAFVDLRLPGMPGTALVRLLSRDAPNTSVIIVCGEPSDLTTIPDGQAFIVMRKPPSIEALEDILSRIRL